MESHIKLLDYLYKNNMLIQVKWLRITMIFYPVCITPLLFLKTDSAYLFYICTSVLWEILSPYTLMKIVLILKKKKITKLFFSGNALFGGNRVIEVNQENLKISSDLWSKSYNLDIIKIEYAITNGKYIYLPLVDTQIPLTTFKSEDEKLEFLNMVGKGNLQLI